MTVGIFLLVTVPLVMLLVLAWIILTSVEKIAFDVLLMRDELDRRSWPGYKPDHAAYRDDDPSQPFKAPPVGGGARSHSLKTSELEALRAEADKPHTISVTDSPGGVGGSSPQVNQRRMYKTPLSPFEQPFPNLRSPYNWQDTQGNVHDQKPKEPKDDEK